MSTPASHGEDRTPFADEDRFQAIAVVNRLREAWGVETDAALADVLNTSRQTVSKWRSRNSVPYTEAIFTAEEKNVSLDWLLRGKTKILDTEYDLSIISAIVLHLYRVGYVTLKEGDDFAAAQAISKSAASTYLKTKRTIDLLRRENHMTGEEAARVAIASVGILTKGHRS